MRKREIGFRWRTNKVKLDDTRTWRTQWMFTKDIQPPDIREVLAKYKVRNEKRPYDEYCIGYFEEGKFYAKQDPEANDERDDIDIDYYCEVDVLPDCWVSIDAVEELLTYLWDQMKQEEWHSTKKAFPEDDEEVLCWDKEFGYFVATYVYGGLWRLRNGSIFKRGLDYPQNPDYWARLQKPEEENESIASSR